MVIGSLLLFLQLQAESKTSLASQTTGSEMADDGDADVIKDLNGRVIPRLVIHRVPTLREVKY